MQHGPRSWSRPDRPFLLNILRFLYAAGGQGFCVAAVFMSNPRVQQLYSLHFGCRCAPVRALRALLCGCIGWAGQSPSGQAVVTGRVKAVGGGAVGSDADSSSGGGGDSSSDLRASLMSSDSTPFH